MTDKYYTTSALMKLLDVSPATMYKWIKSGKLKTLKAGRKHMVTEEQLNAFLTTPKYTINPPKDEQPQQST
jgi:excisionase family DNA binding protein